MSVKREEVRPEREPITDANRDQTTSGAEISEGEHEVILHEAEPVVEKRTVARERVSLGTETHTDERQVSEARSRSRSTTASTAARGAERPQDSLGRGGAPPSFHNSKEMRDGRF